MDKQAVKEWQAGWDAVAEVQRQEIQAMTMSDRWRKFIAILHLTSTMGLKRHVDEDEINTVRSRWAYLRRLAEEPQLAGEGE